MNEDHLTIYSRAQSLGASFMCQSESRKEMKIGTLRITARIQQASSGVHCMFLSATTQCSFVYHILDKNN